MRTLKKTLSLLLAVALVLSLTVVGASAAYTGNKVDTLKDAADVGADYSEAVGVMVGLGIIEGYDDGTLRPETTYTREQAAKIIAYMQLGPEKADSLRCTTAPFTDVAADRWSAGYIAYCVEKGIIDGMGDGTFQPEAQLTGYQWAKMLLCAVGYGVNDEYVGNSWSLNTAKDALDKGIFDGDLEGADHTPLQRQQAVLYAFNALTNEKASVVVYSPSLGDYIWAYGTFAERVTYEGTLGWNVYKLAVSEGIVVGNEATGEDYTLVNTENNYTISGQKYDRISADTGLDLMYHAVRIWHANNAAVYVIDLAKTETATCGAIGSMKDGDVHRTIGDSTGGKLYEYSLIDNSALKAGTVDVSFYYEMGQLGTRYTDSVYFDGAKINNDYIKTNIDDIDRGDSIIYIKAGNKAYHVFAVGATSGTVSKVDNKTKVITLSDGTALEASVFAEVDLLNEVVNNGMVGRTYAFVLDTHGHYVAVSVGGGQSVAYYTGAARFTTDHSQWFNEFTYEAEFVNVTTGEPTTYTVSSSWVKNNEPGYYDVGNASSSGVYNPKEVTESKNTYGVYDLKAAGTRFTSGTYKVSNVNKAGEVYFDVDDVTFIIVSGSGSSLNVEIKTGVAGLLDLYKTSAVTLENIAMTVNTAAAQNHSASVIFSYNGDAVVDGQYIFFPDDTSIDDWSNDGYGWIYEHDAYLNGDPDPILVRVSERQELKRGFYTYTVKDGIYTLTPAAIDEYVYDRNTNMASVYGNSDYVYITYNGVEKKADASTVILDLRTDFGDYGDFKVEDLGDLVWANDNVWDEETVQFAYTFTGSHIDVIYVIDDNSLDALFLSLSDELVKAGWSIVGDTTVASSNYYPSGSYTVTLANKNLTFANTANYSDDVVVDVDSNVKGITAGALTAVSGTTNQLQVTLSGIPAQNTIRVELGGMEMKVSFEADESAPFTVSAPTGEQTIVLGSIVDVTLWSEDAEVTGTEVDVTFTPEATFPEPEWTETDSGTWGNDDHVTVQVVPGVWGTFTITETA